MRNLKKFLALVLAMMMAFSLMLTANAKTTGPQFDDAKDVTPAFEEAVDVLVGMKVFQGDEGGFRPASSITRAEVAAIIYRLATGDTGTEKMDLYATTHPFTDVAASDWFAGYVGYCWNAGYIKGTTATTFNPYDSVTGYEVLAMVLRAMGYDAKDEFTGSQWIVNVSAIATQRGLLDKVKTTHYGNTLYLASRRDVVASILFEAAQKTRVKYTPAYGYQTGDHTSDNIQDLYDDYSSLGWLNFGLVSTNKGVVIGNQQTGEDNTRLGFGRYITRIDDMARQGGGVHFGNIPFGGATPYTFDGDYDALALGVKKSNGTDYNKGDLTISVKGTNDIFNVETGIDLFGHNVKIWFDGRDSQKDIVKGRPVYAYYDKATKTDVVTVKGHTTTGAAPTNATNLATQADNHDDGGRNLNEVATAAGFKVDKTNGAVFSNSFGLFGSDFTDEDEAFGSGQMAINAENIASPVRLYKLISNANLTNKADQLDVVIALNIETSQITESNAVNRVPTIGMPVSNIEDVALSDANKLAQLETNFVTDKDHNKENENVKKVGNSEVVTGVIAKDALVGNSTSTLGDYEFGVHITGTTPRTVSDDEATAINNQKANKTELETAYFLMAKVTPDVTGKVVAFNVNEGTVTLEDGTVLHRSKYYNTVANKNSGNGANAVYGKYRDTYSADGLKAADWALPQSVDQNGVESYNPTTYKFYMDFEGKYLGAERTHDSGFIYGTYLDYDQKTSTSTFTYYLTGIDLEGKQQTYPVSKYWKFDKDTQADPNRKLTTITNTNEKMYQSDSTVATKGGPAPVPFRDTVGGDGVMNYIGAGVYTGFTINGTTLDANWEADTINQTDYFVNMARLGIKNGDNEGLDEAVTIRKSDSVLGAKKVNGTLTNFAGTDLYFTEDTKFILVSGYGTDTAKGEVYDGISKLLGSSNSVTIDWDEDGTGVADPETAKQRLLEGTTYNSMTYFKNSPYVYAQSGNVDQKVDVVILPKDAVEWSNLGSTLYYMGDPNYSMISSHEGTPIYQYTVYRDGVAEKVWLTNDPAKNAYNTGVYADTFLLLRDKEDNKEPTTGGDVYTAEFLVNDGATNIKDGTNTDRTNHTDYTNYTAFANDVRVGWPAIGGTNAAWQNNSAYGITDVVNYRATTRNAQAATFTWTDGTPNSVFLRVAEAKVTNLNAANASSGLIWPGITDLATLNEAGSIDPVTGRNLKVAAQLDPTNPLVVTHIYVCWDQSQDRP